MADPAISKVIAQPDRQDPALLDDGLGDTPKPPAVPPLAARPTAAPRPAVLQTRTPEPDGQEVDLWWGSYAARTMTPSLVVCVALTGLIAWAAWLSLPRGLVQLTIIGLAGAVWLFEAVRWSYRVFGYNYRLTTRRLFSSKGILLTSVRSVNLADVAQVQVRYVGHEKLIGVGKIIVRLEDAAQRPLVLPGVRSPERMAERIREFVDKARAGRVLESRISSAS
jgi:hypothetical protein